MDIYLPADFHELHDAAADDWRDLSTTRTERTATTEPRADSRSIDAIDDCADPTWRVI
jgi:hypothetical protein